MPSIFTFEATEGRIEPAPGRTPARVQVVVRCAPTEPGLFRSRFRFAVAHGRSAELDVEVEATLDEADDEQHLTEQHADDFVLREALL